ncbi:bifunctional adenosylcobinamide kinase/adenosylcobinamide-phosphate guanylyltransferase [Billgrantia kenyensis]|uniref:Adenosylcobinamide kinase n=1 Tax=Billgrantia kenyensis TaxID=321266 RepID=A0A7W0AF60_9GAMM|nr:bifunctional adenosylcobinamide kinase/adenosylcobinamide-phosphate guanylyltransferase [Halomonas kenyensis]MBA2780026.1 bifunctional adenosylcobinamide kinase/adenosylcobinamide-phosphate guanylyltransferase [Halomonas kenyensis]MCG6662959.1 adenosylcobinamide kinase [Halomonas kenyensis]
MQLFIGGTCAGKRDAVTQRFDAPHWHSAHAGCRLEAWRSRGAARCLVLEGWECWIAEQLADEPNDDRLRRAMMRELDALHAWEAEWGGEAVLILLEMGRGIVPIGRENRRLRDLNGWLAQDAAARCERVWYVWNGLVKELSR